MGFYYEKVVRPVLFRMDPEKAHDLGVTALDYLGRVRPLCRFMEWWNLVEPPRPIKLFGLEFPNAVGLAAGMDKNGRFWRAGPALGFGHVEIGTVTYRQQPGNERPRVFRYPEHGAIINRMGFNNEGAEAIASRLRQQLGGGGKTRRIPLGINIGKSRIVPLDQAVEDYLHSFRSLVDYADYIVVNVSSPNTRDLRKLQAEDQLDVLLAELRESNLSRARKLGQQPTPLLLKIAPDLSFREIDNVLETLERREVNGIVATNTTVERPQPMHRVRESGGLSGAPLHRRSLQVVNYIHRCTGGRLPIIGVGGISGPETAGAMMDAGATLVQIYSGMVYKGPFVAKGIARALAPRQSNWI
ncbi:MAG: quinone-dependent dihydroorotate dehydrogenase [Verrucomicrobia bacterium]|jgi:dihydroorotate dehydrogenase|nr:quinone-dependent dihydroorotate dehydrogenase [Verrucomicrobiota bacterium]